MSLKILVVLLLLANLTTQTCLQDPGLCESNEFCNRHQECQALAMFPMNYSQMFGLLLISVLVAVAQNGIFIILVGIGGGPLFIPLLQVFFSYTANISISISYVMIFSAGVGNIIQKYFKNKDASHPFMDFNLLLIAFPALAAGALYGQILHHLLPELLIFFFLLFVMFNSSKSIYEKIQQQKKETLLQKNVSLTSSILRENDVQSEDTRRLIDIYTLEKRPFPMEKLNSLASFTLLILFLLLCKGSAKAASILGFSACGSGYYLMVAVITLVSLAYFQKNRIEILKIELEKEALRFYEFVEQIEPRKDDQMIKFLFFQSAYVSILGSLLGLGGGIIMTPLLIMIGFDTVIVSNTVSVITMMASFLNFFQILIQKSYGFQQVMVFALISCFSSLVISKIISDYIERTKKKVLLLQLLLGLIICCTIMAIFIFIESLFTHPSTLIQFGSVC